MTTFLLIMLALMIAAAIAVQIFYVRGMQTSGGGVPTAAKVITYVNVAILAVMALGLIAYAFVRAGR